MARKKLSALAIQKLSPGDWHDTSWPAWACASARTADLDLSLQRRRQEIALVLGYHPAMGLAEAREAARKASSGSTAA